MLSKLLKSDRAFIQITRRYSSILSRLELCPVLVSTNKDVYTNLALEHWLYKNSTFRDETEFRHDTNKRVFPKPIVLIWTDEPCVVIGRHQNPWIESTLGIVDKANVKLARRYSGGGCVYHDENNINISIIGHRKTFEHRQSNLKFLADVIERKYNIKCNPTPRYDLVHEETGRKVSGSAAKLGRQNCVHHFTLLVDTDMDALHIAIRQNQQPFIESNSTASIRSEVINLKRLKASLDVNRVTSDLAFEYGKLYGGTGISSSTNEDRVNCDEMDYNRFATIKEELESWKWLYGMTPRFKLRRSVALSVGEHGRSAQFTVGINKGLFETIEIEGDLDCKTIEQGLHGLIGTKFNYREAMINVAGLLNKSGAAKPTASVGVEIVFITHLLQMIHESNF